MTTPIERIAKGDPDGLLDYIEAATGVRATYVEEPGDWRKADGVLHGVGHDEPGEVTIRRLRDGGPPHVCNPRCVPPGP